MARTPIYNTMSVDVGDPDDPTRKIKVNADGSINVTASVSASIAAFNPTGEAALAVSNSSSRVALDSADPTALIVNTGSVVVYVAFGDGTVVATISSYPIQPGWAIAFNTGGAATYVAAITASSTSNLTITTGTGLPAIGAAGASSGGGAVTIADGADVALGAIADAAATAGGTGTLSAKLRRISTQLPAVLGQTTMAASEPVTIASDQSAVPENLTEVGGAALALGQAASSASIPVVLPSDQVGTPNSAIVPNNTTAVVVKNAPGVLFGIECFNNSGTIAYLKIYDATSATAGSGTPVLRYMIPANTSGAGFVAISSIGRKFATGITYIVTTGIADNDTGAPAASAYIVNMNYK